MIVDDAANIRNLSHPFHMHGYGMQVIGMGQHPNKNPINEKGEIDSQYMMPMGHVPPIKDTILIPSRGFIVLRFKADNPGFWLMHCHFEWHLGIGMGLVFQVGDTAQMKRLPLNMPQCGDYTPRVMENNV